MKRTHRLPTRLNPLMSVYFCLGFLSLILITPVSNGSGFLPHNRGNESRNGKAKKLRAVPPNQKASTDSSAIDSERAVSDDARVNGMAVRRDHTLTARSLSVAHKTDFAPASLMGMESLRGLANHSVFNFLRYPVLHSESHTESVSTLHASFKESEAEESVLSDNANLSNFELFVPPVPQSPNAKIVFASNRDGSRQIYVMNGDGSNQVRLTFSGANDDFPRWSPDGAKILFQSDRDNPDSGCNDIYMMNADGSGVTRLTSDPNDDSMATWSSDGSKIVFQSLRTGNYQIYSMSLNLNTNMDGPPPVNLTNTGSSDGEPSWSADGSIAFASDRDHTGYASIYVMSSDGSNQQRLTFGSGTVEDKQPVWSPDGSRIGFVSTRDSTTETWQETDDDGNYITKSQVRINKEIYVMNADGSGQSRLTNDPANDDSPSWSPSGLTILFRSDRERECCDPSSQVWSMNADGTNQTNVSNSGNSDYSASVASGFISNDSQLASDYSGGTNRPPIANAGGSYIAQTGQTIQLNGGGSFDPDGTIVSYSWNFGDGTSGTGSVVNHQYSAPGVYPVSLAVTDNSGNTTSSPGFVTVDSVAFPVKITFEDLPTNVNTVVTDRYLSQYGASFSSGNFFYPVHTSQNCGPTCSATSGSNFITTKPDDIGLVIVTFSQPVSNLVFYAVGVDRLSGTFAFVDLYRNGSVTPTNTFAMNGIFNTTVGFTSGSLNNIDKVVVRGITDAAGIGFDDFSFTVPADVKITNPRITGSLNGTAQKSLVGANIVLNAAPTLAAYAGGTYSWSFTGPAYSVSSGSQSASSITIRPTATGTLTAKLTYTKNGMEVTPTVNINVTIPTLTQFGADMLPDELNSNQFCGGNAGVTHSIGCWQPPEGPENGIVWTATANIPSATYLSDPAESGIKFIQAVDLFIKFMKDGNRNCITGRVSDIGQHWFLDSDDPYNHDDHPPRYFSEGNTLTMGDFDSPTYTLKTPGFSLDASYVDSNFETYVFYFTSNPVGRNPRHPNVIYQRAIPLQGSTYSYAKLAWSWNSHVVFDYNSSPSTLLYKLNSNTHGGIIQAEGTNETKPMVENIRTVIEAPSQPCIDSPETTNPIDGSEFYTAQLYLDFFERQPDEGGGNYWRSFITRCGFDAECIERERVHIALAQVYSTEYLEKHSELTGPRGTHDYNEAFVRWCYRTFLRREPDDPPDNNLVGFYFWVDKLDSTNPDYDDYKYSEMLRAFINSIEYRQRFE